MRKILLLCVLTVFSMAQDWQYLIYVTGAEYKNKQFSNYAVINQQGQKVAVGNDKKVTIANAQMLKKYSNYRYKEAFELDVLRILGDNGWELITILGEPNSSNKKYYFKKRG